MAGQDLHGKAGKPGWQAVHLVVADAASSRLAKAGLLPLGARSRTASRGAQARWDRGAASVLQTGLPPGISVVVPSRNGKDLLARLLPGLLAQLDPATSEVIVVDNGSEDGTAAFLEREFPQVAVQVSVQALAFSVAVNRGAARAKYSHLLLLNNDMVVERGFTEALRTAFEAVPDLFCATSPRSSCRRGIPARKRVRRFGSMRAA